MPSPSHAFRSTIPTPSPSTASRKPHGFLPALAFAALAAVMGCTTVSLQKATGPWSLSELSRTPQASWGATNGLVQELYYEGEPREGKPTRIFAYLGRPVQGSSTLHPAMVLVHGGGGKAFKDWAAHWAARGYVALAMDLAGNGPNGRLPDGGPDQADAVKFRNFSEADAPDMWTYHAVAAVLRGHSLVRSLPDVDPNRTGITGISWGGYLTCIAAGIDDRFKVAVPVYGCGFLDENSCWRDTSLASMNPEARAQWIRLFDPRQYVGQVRYPILFVNGTTDFAYPMDSYLKTYRLVPEQWRHVSMTVNRPHGHIWTFPEVDGFVDQVLRDSPPLVRFGPVQMQMQRQDDSARLSAKLEHAADLKEFSLCFTTDSGTWQKRKWQTAPARLEAGRLTADLPTTRPLVAFLVARDKADRQMSSEHVELPK